MSQQWAWHQPPSAVTLTCVTPGPQSEHNSGTSCQSPWSRPLLHGYDFEVCFLLSRKNKHEAMTWTQGQTTCPQVFCMSSGSPGVVCLVHLLVGIKHRTLLYCAWWDKDNRDPCLMTWVASKLLFASFLTRVMLISAFSPAMQIWLHFLEFTHLTFWGCSFRVSEGSLGTGYPSILFFFFNRVLGSKVPEKLPLSRTGYPVTWIFSS